MTEIIVNRSTKQWGHENSEGEGKGATHARVGKDAGQDPDQSGVRRLTPSRRRSTSSDVV